MERASRLPQSCPTPLALGEEKVQRCWIAGPVQPGGGERCWGAEDELSSTHNPSPGRRRWETSLLLLRPWEPLPLQERRREASGPALVWPEGGRGTCRSLHLCMHFTLSILLGVRTPMPMRTFSPLVFMSCGFNLVRRFSAQNCIVNSNCLKGGRERRRPIFETGGFACLCSAHEMGQRGAERGG